MRHRFGPASRGSSSYHFKVMGWEGVWAGTHSASAASTATTATERNRGVACVMRVSQLKTM